MTPLDPSGNRLTGATMSGMGESAVGVERGCACGEVDCLSFGMDYPWCRPCDEHHRPPECAVDEEGFSLSPCGCRWDDPWADVPHSCRLHLGDDRASDYRQEQ